MSGVSCMNCSKLLNERTVAKGIISSIRVCSPIQVRVFGSIMAISGVAVMAVVVLATKIVKTECTGKRKRSFQVVLCRGVSLSYPKIVKAELHRQTKTQFSGCPLPMRILSYPKIAKVERTGKRICVLGRFIRGRILY